ncbi:MAG: hypothetical protein U0529_14375 [Thermoanaerobaculia bacterium]
MKPPLRALLLAVAAAVLHFAVLAGLTFAGIGPFGRAMRLVTSGAMSTYDEAASQAWFKAAEESVTFDRFVLWPAVFLLVALVGARLLPRPRWWHFLLIASAVLPLSVPVALESSLLPASSHLSSWLRVVTSLLAYALLVGVLSTLARRLMPSSATTAA